MVQGVCGIIFIFQKYGGGNNGRTCSIVCELCLSEAVIKYRDRWKMVGYMSIGNTTLSFSRLINIQASSSSHPIHSPVLKRGRGYNVGALNLGPIDRGDWFTNSPQNCKQNKCVSMFILGEGGSTVSISSTKKFVTPPTKGRWKQ